MSYFDEYATMEVNKETYKKLSLKWHPDRPGGNENVMKQINAEWDLAKKNYASGAWPRQRPAQRKPGFGSSRPFPPPTDPYNIFGGGVRPAPQPEDIYTYEIRNKKYRGTENEIYINVLVELGPQAAIDFLLKVKQHKADPNDKGKPNPADVWADILKNIFE